MNKHFYRIFIIALSIALSGCDTITEMTKGKDNAAPPTPLTDIKASLSLSNSWAKNVGKGGNQHFVNLRPTVADGLVFVASSDGDYLDTLANRYYGDPTLWWIIALANNIGKGRMSVEPGLQLRIPGNVNKIVSEFHTLNKR